jgi:hypothetical protein
VTPDGSISAGAEIRNPEATPFLLLVSSDSFTPEVRMSRNRLGQFEKGTCGNPRGRPRKVRHPISENQLRADFFEASEKTVSIVEGNQRKRVPARVAIDLQLVAKAVAGEPWAIREYNKRRERFTLEHVKEHLENLRVICDGEDRIRMFPEDVTDEFKRVIDSLKLAIDPHFLP